MKKPLTPEEKADRKRAADERRDALSLKYPYAYMEGIRCDIRMTDGSARVELCIHGSVNEEARIMTLVPAHSEKLQDLKEVILGLVARYNAAIEDLNATKIPELIEAE